MTEWVNIRVLVAFQSGSLWQAAAAAAIGEDNFTHFLNIDVELKA